jgi:hypothetical protein
MRVAQAFGFALILLTTLAAPLHADDTEIVLEHGKLEVQLKNDVFINMNPGADIAIRHDDSGAPVSVDVRAGEIQFLSGFSADSEFDVRVGTHTLKMGRGSTILSASRDGGFRAVVLDGARLRIEGLADGDIGPGERLRMDGAGKLLRDSVGGDEMRGLRGRFIKKLRKSDADTGDGPKKLRRALADPDGALKAAAKKLGDGAVNDIQQRVEDALDDLPLPPVAPPPPPGPPPGPPPPP